MIISNFALTRQETKFFCICPMCRLGNWVILQTADFGKGIDTIAMQCPQCKEETALTTMRVVFGNAAPWKLNLN